MYLGNRSAWWKVLRVSDVTDQRPGPSRSRHCQLNQVISQGFVKSRSTHKINVVILLKNMLGAFALKNLLTFFSKKW